MPHPKAAASRTRTPRIRHRSSRTGARIAVDGTRVPPWPPRTQPPRLPHSWRLLALVDVRTRQVLEVRLIAADGEPIG